mmetsp:Transcript_34929/g.108636  ORF Transcript_34929/g.108636 Transcript_34929/m.108636 type:complete len:267 (+) Transcript_34929:274-1074(+)
MPWPKGAGLALAPSRPHILAPPHERLHLGFSHWPGVHLQVHWGSAHLLSHMLAHCVEHFGGPQTVLHFGQSPCSQCMAGQTMAHFGGSHFCEHVARLIGEHAVSHWGGAQTGSQTSSQSTEPQDHEHRGWQLGDSCDAGLAGGPMFSKYSGGRGPMVSSIGSCRLPAAPRSSSVACLAAGASEAFTRAPLRNAAGGADGAGAAAVACCRSRVAATRGVKQATTAAAASTLGSFIGDMGTASLPRCAALLPQHRRRQAPICSSRFAA